MSISQLEIARLVGVSRTAVSHVLNGRTHMVGPEVRGRILEAVEVSGYHRNALVKALKANRTHVIGIVVPELKVSFFSEIVRAVEREARANGLQCFLCQSHSLPEDLEKDVNILREYRVDGLLIAPASSTAYQAVYNTLVQQKFPLVLLDTTVEGVESAFVGSQNAAIGRIATRHLLELGHCRIACFRGYPGKCSEQRYDGYRHELRKAGIPLDPDLVVGENFTFESGVEGVSKLLKKRTEFTALVAAADYVALGAIQELARNGLRVPEDISVVGCANLDVSEMVTPPLTTVDQKPQEIGELAVRLLIKQIEEGCKSLEQIKVNPRLVVRETSARPSASRSS